eukprot:scaffold59442_cov57-Phaeocystis_antarctica.AAC.3
MSYELRSVFPPSSFENLAVKFELVLSIRFVAFFVLNPKLLIRDIRARGAGRHTRRHIWYPKFARAVSYTNCLGHSAASGREISELGFPCRSRAQRRSPLVVRGRLLELRCQARPRLPSLVTRPAPAQHQSPHAVGWRIVRRRQQNPRRQRLEPLVVPPLRLGHLAAPLPPQLVEGPCCGLCPELRALRMARLGLEVPLCGLHVVPRVVERCAKVVVRRGPVGPQGNGLAVGPGCSAPVLVGLVLHTLGQ